MIEVIMNFLPEIPTWILGGIALLLFIGLLFLINIFFDNKDTQPQKKNTALSNLPHRLYPGHVYTPIQEDNVKDLIVTRIKKNNDNKRPNNSSEINDDDNNEEPEPPDPTKSSKHRLKLIQGGKSGKKPDA